MRCGFRVLSRPVQGLITGFVWLAAVGALEADTALLASRLDRFVRDPKWSRLQVGVRVETLGEDPEVVYDYRGREPMTPASNQKLVTTAAALCLLPRDFTYRTILARRGDDLVIIGAGDPSIGDPRLAEQAGTTITSLFHAWADVLKAHGITTVAGDLIYDDFIFDHQFLHPSWVRQQKNLAAWYTAPVGGLNFCDNCVGVVIETGPKPGTPAKVRLVPTTRWTKLDNTAVTASRGQPLVHRVGDGPITITVRGKVSRSNDPKHPLWVTVPDPGAFFATTARTVWAARGIRIAGRTRRDQVRRPGADLPEDLEVLAVHETRLTDLLKRMNRDSLNMFAEAVLKTLGAYGRDGTPVAQGTFELGRKQVERFLDALGLAGDRYDIDDGSGLSRDNRLAPLVLTAVLRYMDRHPLHDVWWASLARAGEPDGTLKRRMKDLKGKVFAKTGHIAGVSALSGYVLGLGGRRYAFSAICHGSGSHPLQDGICRILATWGGSETAAAGAKKQ